MAYEKIGWKDYPDKTTPMNAKNLGHMEEGIFQNSVSIGEVSKIASIGDGTCAGAIDAVNKKAVALDANLAGKALAVHFHDDRYHTAEYVTNMLNGKANIYHNHDYLPLTGGWLTGPIYLANNVKNSAGDDVFFGDFNVSGCLCLQSKNINAITGLALFYSDNQYTRLLTANDTLYLCATNGTYISDSGSGSRAPIYASAFTQQSSRRVKENILDLAEEEALKLLELRPVNYDYIKNGEKNCNGLIAEEVAKILPSCVVGNVDCADDDMDAINAIGIDYSKFVPYMIKLLQMQQKEIDSLKSDRKQR